MKNAYEVLYRKEADLARVRTEIDSLRLVASLLTENDMSFFEPKGTAGTQDRKPAGKVAPPESTRTGGQRSRAAGSGFWGAFKQKQRR